MSGWTPLPYSMLLSPLYLLTWLYTTSNPQNLIKANSVKCEHPLTTSSTHLKIHSNNSILTGVSNFILITKSLKTWAMILSCCFERTWKSPIVCFHHTTLQKSWKVIPRIAFFFFFYLPWIENHDTLASWGLIETYLESILHESQ